MEIFRFAKDICKIAADNARKFHIPALVHVTEATQPFGHSTSGSQERYKSADRLAWESEYDCLSQVPYWIIQEEILDEKSLDKWQDEDLNEVEKARKSAWEAFQSPINPGTFGCNNSLMQKLTDSVLQSEKLEKNIRDLSSIADPIRKDIAITLHSSLVITRT